MGKKVDGTDADRGTGMSTQDMSKNIKHDHRTIKDFVHCGKTETKDRSFEENIYRRYSQIEDSDDKDAP